MRERIARLVAPHAWDVHDAVIAAINGVHHATRRCPHAVGYARFLREASIKTDDAVRIWFREGQIGTFGSLSEFQRDVQNSLRTADAILGVIAAAEPDWHPLSSAPRDSRIVEVRDRAGAVSRACFRADFGGGRWCYVDARGIHAGKAYGLTEWRPLHAGA